MSLQDLGSLGELVGAVATVATLIYLAIQIRSNTQAMKSSAAQSVHESFATWYRMLAADPDLAMITTNALRDYDSQPDASKARAVATFMALLSCAQDAFVKWREGSLSTELWTGWESVLMNLFGAPGGKLFWAERHYLFGEAFRAYVENDLMTRRPHPDAKPMGVFSIE